jgi:hypothetical protein
MPICKDCGKHLRGDGIQGVDGRYHKKCWAKIPTTKPSTESIVRNVLGISMAEFNERLERIGN